MKGPRIISAVPLGLVLVSSCGRCLAWAAGSPQLESIGTHLLVHSAQSSSATLEGQAAELWNKHLALEEDRPSAWLQHCLQVLGEAYPDTQHDTQHTQQHRAAVCGRLEGPWSEVPRPGLPASAKRSLRSSSWGGGGWSPHVAVQEGSSWASFDNDRDVISLVGAACCVLCAAIAAGLTIGLMSIDPLELEIKQRVGTVAEKAQAGRVLPLITRHHVLLVTLLLYNAAANEALPIFFDDLMPTPYAVGLSVTMVLLFGEILPSALFSGPKQLRIAAKLSGLVWCLIYLLAPIAMPLAWLLDRFVGPHNHRKRYTRAELSALIEIHQEVKQNRRRQHHHVARQPSHNGTTLPANTHKNNGGWSQLSEPLLAGTSTNGSGLGEGGLYASLRRGGPLSPSNGNGLSDAPPGSMLSQDEVDIVLGVLKIASKTVQDCMVPMEQVFCLSTDEVLSEETLALVMASGYSRIPVFQGGDVSHLRGFLLVKRLIVLDPKARRNVGSVSLRQPLVVSPSFPLIDLLNTFQEGRSHLALVSKLPQQAIDCMANGQPLHGDAAPLGIITLEDVIEEILQEEILDEHDRGRQFGESSHYYHNNTNTNTRLGGAKQLLSASLLRKCPSGGCSEEGEGLLQQVAVDMAVVQHTASMPLPTPPPPDCTSSLCLPPPGIISPSQRFKRLSQSSAPLSSPHKRFTTRPRSASNSASSSLPSPSKPRRVSLSATSPLVPAPPSLDRTESSPGPAYVPDPCPASRVGGSSSAPSAPSGVPVGPISSMLLPPPTAAPHPKVRPDPTQGPTQGPMSLHGAGQGDTPLPDERGDDKPILRSNPYF